MRTRPVFFLLLLVAVLVIGGCGWFQSPSDAPELSVEITDGTTTYEVNATITVPDILENQNNGSYTYSIVNSSEATVTFRNADELAFTGHTFDSSDVGTGSDSNPRFAIDTQPPAALDPGDTEDFIISFTRVGTGDPSRGEATARLTVEVEDESGNAADFFFEFYGVIC